MALIRGAKSKRPCPICLVDADELADVTKTSTLRTVADTQRLVQQARVIQRMSERDKALSEYGLRDIDVSGHSTMLCMTTDF
jgi:hypothetical protein